MNEEQLSSSGVKRRVLVAKWISEGDQSWWRYWSHVRYLLP